MADKKDTKIDKIEREYIIPLREKCRPSPRYKKTPKAVKTIKEFLVRHMKIYDRDLKKIKIDRYLNEYLWFRGIKNPPHKVKVKVVKEGDIVKVELAELPGKLEFKKLKEEKMDKDAEAGKKKVPEKKEKVEENDKDKDGVDDKKEEEEKKSAVVEAGEEMEKDMKKKKKHETKMTSPEQEKRNVKEPQAK